MMRVTSLLTSVFLATLWVVSAQANVPRILHYQGVLSDTAGNPIHCLADGSCAKTYSMTFKLYAQPDGGLALYEQSEAVVSIVNGVFEVTLGKTTPIGLNVISSGEVYLGVSINGAAEMSPRLRVASSAFAMRADHAISATTADKASDADTLGGNPPETFLTPAAAEALMDGKGYCEAPCYGDNNVETLLSDKGYTPFSGSYNDLSDSPDLSGYCAAPCYGDVQVQNYLNAQGYVAGAQYTDSDVADYLSAQGFQPGAPYSDAQVKAYLDLMGYEAGPKYSDDDVAAYLATNGYAPGPYFSGSFADLTSVPEVLGKLGVTPEGTLTFDGTPVVDKSGTWVGDPTGLKGPKGDDGAAGTNGVSVTSAVVNDEDKLVVTLSNDTVTTSDSLIGPAGEPGADGVSVTAAAVNDEGKLVVTLSNDTVTTSASLIGPPGQPGKAGSPGEAGQNGSDGAPGTSVTSAVVNGNQQLVVTLSDGTAYVSDSLKGEQGTPGILSPGTAPGQTARWTGTQWVIDNALTNTGSQVGVNTSAPDTTAALEVNSQTQGFLMPRLTSTQRDAIASPAVGLMLFNITTGCFNHWTGAVWKELCAACEAPFDAPVVSGDDAVPCGTSSETYSVTPAPGVNAYTWSVPSGASIISGQGTSEIAIDFGNSPGGKVSVVASGECPNSPAGELDVGVAGNSGSTTYGFTGSVQTFLVPPCVNSVSVDVRGAQGGNSNSYGSGGLGGQVSAEIAVYPGQTLYVYVGSQPSLTGSNAPGGWNGGGNASTSPQVGGGGGASDIRTMGGAWDDANGLLSRLVVAGGGGGRASNDADSRGGGLTSFGPYPASQTSAGKNGGFGVGGDAKYCGCGYYSAGGGGGWYGGGSHGNSGTQSGSGGSSYYSGTGVTQGSTLPGVRTGNGQVTISW